MPWQWPMIYLGGRNEVLSAEFYENSVENEGG
jgi:hypothetical protein